MKNSLLIIALTVFILTSATAIADSNEKNISPIGSINFTDSVVNVLDHTSSSEEGNWIIMGNPHTGTRIKLPHPIKLTYTGPKHVEFGGTSGTLYKDENKSFTIDYPSANAYSTLPIYLPGEEATMSFYGESGLEGKVNIFLIKVTPETAFGVFNAFEAKDTGNLNRLFNSSVKESYKKYSAVLGKDGDLLNYSLGPLGPGQYNIVMIQENEDGSLTALSTTAFMVAEYKLLVSSPKSVVKKEDLKINVDLVNASDERNCTYGAVLISKQAYKAKIEVDTDGKRNGTSVIVNDMDIIDKFGINSSNYRSKLTQNELQKEIQTLIGEENGAIAIGERGQKILSLTTLDLSKGNYYLFVGAYYPGKGLVGLTQLKVAIVSKSSGGDNGSGGDDESGDNGSGGDDESGNNGSGSGGSSGSHGSSGCSISPESTKNIDSKELCQQSISKGNRIRFEFTKGATCVGYVGFTAKKTVGKITAIVEELKGKSALTSSEPVGEIYKYLNIRIGNSDFANLKNIENATVGFKVSKEWINENNINTDSLTLQHFSDKKWNSLPTTKINEDKEYIYFEAKPPSFSPFAITAQKNALMLEEKTGNSQLPHETVAENEKRTKAETAVASQENKNQVMLKITSLFLGFLLVLVIGIIVIRKKT
ncbi:TIGR04279 domain-containing protein [Methanosarcina sp. UBA5]|uniref:TIGR04279 domain-containing protein n=1 Tax=Methanosarcina sp. UBA5 TaxID=1915593 RepID=UPI0025D3040A|nr:TIGR04279 domain-containing protein [Methanosarcina sp. UBA5]